MLTNPALTTGLAERLAGTARSQASPAVPIDLGELARALDVRRIEFASMVEEGRTCWIDGRPEIALRSGRPRVRTRFTLAHELGHVLIADGKSGALAKRTRSLEPSDEEILCDWIAAALLMPRDWVLPYARRDIHSLSL